MTRVEETIIKEKERDLRFVLCRETPWKTIEC